MKRYLIFAVAGLLALSVVPASAGKGKKARQDTTGSVALPHPNPSDNTCITGNHRRANLYGNDMAQGIVGASFPIDPKTAGSNFQLHVIGGSADVDLDIAFYAGMGSPDDPSSAPANISFEEREAGGEMGKVPAGFDTAIICMYAGSNAEFHYEAGKGVKLGTEYKG